MNEQQIDIKALTEEQLGALYIQISITNRLNERTLESITDELVNRKNKPKETMTPLVLPKLKRKEVVGTFEPPSMKNE